MITFRYIYQNSNIIKENLKHPRDLIWISNNSTMIHAGDIIQSIIFKTYLKFEKNDKKRKNFYLNSSINSSIVMDDLSQKSSWYITSNRNARKPETPCKSSNSSFSSLPK